jgi:iron only hydrogenase large subunit-like protein
VTVIRTDETRCRGSQQCLRTCAVRAIELVDGRTQVIDELCIGCAACVRACPQQAKVVRDDVALVRDALAEDRRVVACVSPSLPVFLPFGSFGKIRQTLLHLGFAEASETTLGAAMVAEEYRDLLQGANGHKPIISSSCPGIVSLIEKHNPDLIPYLAPVVSPLIAHGRWLKSTEEEPFVVFVGPCVAAKLEVDDEAVAGAVDVALTFSELAELLEAEGTPLPAQTPAGTIQDVDPFSARLLSVGDGLVRTESLDAELSGRRVVTTSGVDSCLQILESLRSGRLEVDLVEALLCSGGCIDGPLPKRRPVDRRRVFAYLEKSQPPRMPARRDWPDLDRTFKDRSAAEAVETDEESRSFRERAIATIRNVAESTVSGPQSRRRADSVAKVVLDLTPNLVIAIDSDLCVVSMSPSAERAFRCNLAKARYRPLSDILSPIDDFVRAQDHKRAIVRSKVRYRPDLIVEQTIVPATEEDILVAIMRDITVEEKGKEELSRVAQETIQRTQEVINFQMQVAHEIASLLGETTAESKTQLGRLIQLVKGLKGIEIP